MGPGHAWIFPGKGKGHRGSAPVHLDLDDGCKYLGSADGGLTRPHRKGAKAVFSVDQVRVTWVSKSVWVYHWLCLVGPWRREGWGARSWSWHGMSHGLLTRWSTLLISPELRDFPELETSEAKAGVFPDKMGWLVTLPLTTHNKVHIPRIRGLQGRGSRRHYRTSVKVLMK